MLQSSRPHTTAYDADSDWSRYAFGYKGFPQAFRPAHLTPDLRHEKDTIHFGSKGVLQDDNSHPEWHWSHEYYGSSTFVHAHYTTWWDLDRLQNYIYVAPIPGGSYASFGFSSGYDTALPYQYRCLLPKVWEELAGREVVYLEGFPPDRHNLLTFSGFTFEEYYHSENSGEQVFGFTFENHAYSHHVPLGGSVPVEGIYVYAVELRIPWALTLPPKIYEPTLGSQRIRASFVSEPYYNCRLISRQCNYAERGAWPIDTGKYEPLALIVREAPTQLTIFNGGVNTLVLEDFERSDRHFLWRSSRRGMEMKFLDFVQGIHPDVRPAAALSANDCIEKYHSDTNLLEAIPELPGLIRSVLDVSSYKRLIKLLREVPDVGEILKFLSEKYLLYTYGVSPGKDDAATSYETVSTIWDRLTELGPSFPNVLYGEFRVPTVSLPKFPFLDGELSVKVRTKMELRNGPGNLLAIALLLDELGLLPTTARLWDLVKFSFVLDWFTRIGDRLEDVDQTTIRGAFDVDYYVHTYVYTFRCDPRSLLPFHSTSSAGQQLRVFLREVSLFHPGLFDSKIDMRPAHGLHGNRLAISGALICVLS
jgi:hypothetical protein